MSEYGIVLGHTEGVAGRLFGSGDMGIGGVSCWLLIVAKEEGKTPCARYIGLYKNAGVFIDKLQNRDMGMLEERGLIKSEF